VGRPDVDRKPGWLSAAEAAAIIGIPETTFVDLVEHHVPAGLPLNQRTIRWRRDVVAAVTVLLLWLLERARGSKSV
jgi:hypothetical protein